MLELEGLLESTYIAVAHVEDPYTKPFGVDDAILQGFCFISCLYKRQMHGRPYLEGLEMVKW